MRKIMLVSVTIIGLGIGCVDNSVGKSDKDSDGGNPTAPTQPAPEPQKIDHRVQLIVTGSVSTATIKTTSEKEGTQVLQSALLPWTSAFHVDKDSTFLSISATTFEAGFLTVQIWVDNKLLRETSVTSTFPDPVLGLTAAISGNFDISDSALSLLPTR